MGWFPVRKDQHSHVTATVHLTATARYFSTRWRDVLKIKNGTEHSGRTFWLMHDRSMQIAIWNVSVSRTFQFRISPLPGPLPLFILGGRHFTLQAMHTKGWFLANVIEIAEQDVMIRRQGGGDTQVAAEIVRETEQARFVSEPLRLIYLNTLTLRVKHK